MCGGQACLVLFLKVAARGTHVQTPLPPFSNSKFKQDAAEYWAHLLELAARAEHAGRSRLGLGPEDVSWRGVCGMGKGPFGAGQGFGSGAWVVCQAAGRLGLGRT